MRFEKQELLTSPTAGLLRNTFFSAASWASTFVFLILLIMAARFLGDEGYGKFAFALALVSLFEVTTDLGIKEYVLRESARIKDQTMFFIGNALIIKVFLSISTIGILIILALFLDIDSDVRLVISILTFSMVFKSFKLLFRSIFIGHERFKLEAFVVSIERLILLVFGVLVFILGGGIVSFASAFTIASFITLLLTISFFNRKIVKIQLVWDFSFAWKLIKESIPFGMTAAAFMIYFRIDSVMLSFFRNDVEVGWYNAAYRITEGLIVLPTIIYYVLYPRLSVLHEMEKDSVIELSQRACKYVMAISLPITFLGIITAEPFVLLIYGKEYINAAGSWKVLLLGITFMFLWSNFIALLNSINRPKVPFIGVVIGSITNIFLNIFLIPRYGYIGASVSTVIAEIILFSFLSISLLRYGYKLNLMKNALKPIIASALSIGVIILFMKGNAFLSVLIGTFIYIFSLVCLRFFDAQEIQLLREIKSSLSNFRRYDQ